jgi:two-component system sensor histidine kinase DegS
MIKDNGVGFSINKKDKIKTLGLLGMKERVEMLNGKYKIVSNENKGTSITVSLPAN